MANIGLETPDGRIDAVLEVPEAGTGPWPSVVIVHDGLGMNDDIRGVARRFAAQGYVVMVPDLYTRGGFAHCVVRAFRDMFSGRGRAVDDLLAARDALTARPDTTGTVGIAGFCLGGGFALALAPKGFDASAPFYGNVPRNAEDVLAESCPIVASFGKRDPTLIGAGAKLEKALTHNNIEHDVKTYSGAGHSFANDYGSGLAGTLMKVAGFGYHGEEAEDAFGRVFAFFGEHLKN